MDIHAGLSLAYKSLIGISIGDAFGESFFGETSSILQHIDNRSIPETRWEFTDDTVMAIAVYEQLEKRPMQGIDQDDLALQFARKHQLDVNRGYGATSRRILREIEAGQCWQDVSRGAFDGMGSMGNGAAMRVGPIGACYYDDLAKVKEQAALSAEVTHANPEGIAGAVAVATAAALAARVATDGAVYSPEEFILAVSDSVPGTDTQSKIKKGLAVPYSYHIETVRSILGDGINMTAQDTVPFSIWCAAHNLHNFEESLWKAVSILGDRDTICAIVGGITILSAAHKSIPQTWMKAVEDIETSVFRDRKIG